MKTTRRALLAIGAASAVAPVEAWARAPDAALWEVRAARAKLYLFGDDGPRRTPWRSARVEAAVKESNVFWKEAPDNGPESAGLVMASGVDPAAPLPTWLTTGEHDRVVAAATAVGVPFATLERFRPWLAAQILESSFYKRIGLDQANGAAHLIDIAKAGGAQIKSEFPDMKAIIALASNFSRAASVQSLLAVVDDIEAGTDAQQRRAQAWAAGDLSLQAREVKRWRRVYPDLYDADVVARNRLWPARMRAMLDRGGVSFVLVGDAHLVGPESIQHQLAAAGMHARRV